MIALQVHITAGPQAGTRLQISQSPVTFGRSPENTLVLEVETVSRNHGELLFEDDAWWLVNLSQNGTKVGRKRVTKKPRELTDGASIVIGDEEVFRVFYAGQPAAAEAATAAAESDEQPLQPTSAAPGTGARGRSKLWILLGVWFLICIGLFALLATSLGGEDDPEDPQDSRIVHFQDAEDVLDLLSQPVDRDAADDYRYTQNVERAREMYVREPKERYLYQAYDYYRKAMQYLPAGQELDPVDRQRYDMVVEQLAELVYERYAYAYGRYKQEQHGEAIRAINELQNLYSANPNEDDVAATIMALRGRAAAASGQN